MAAILAFEGPGAMDPCSLTRFWYLVRENIERNGSGTNAVSNDGSFCFWGCVKIDTVAALVRHDLSARDALLSTLQGDASMPLKKGLKVMAR
ncbi:MAG: hypothetical protein ACJAX5_002471 [Patiriisocius sp.]|jgi:hypothetical protein